jgi:hypothetical protein
MMMMTMMTMVILKRETQFPSINSRPPPVPNLRWRFPRWSRHKALPLCSFSVSVGSCVRHESGMSVCANE